MLSFRLPDRISKICHYAVKPSRRRPAMRSIAKSPFGESAVLGRPVLPTICGIGLQPDTRLIQHLVGQRGIIARARQDHSPDHRRPATDRRSALLSSILAWSDAAE